MDYGYDFWLVLFSLTQVSFKDSAHTKYILPEMAIDEDQIMHLKCTISAGCNIIWVKKTRKIFIVFFNGIIIHS